MLRGFTRAMRRMRSMASEFTRGMEDLASENELGDLKSTMADVKSGNLDRIADKIDPGGELKDSVSGIKSNGDFDDAIEELSNIKNIGDDAGQQMMASATRHLRRSQRQPNQVSKRKRARTMADQHAANSEIDQGQMTLIDHLTELRNRLGIALVAFFVIFLVSCSLPGTTSHSIAYHVFVFATPLAEIIEEKEAAAFYCAS